jgi:16S rRNA (cytosine967-C5)-methyltransferase
VGQGGAAGARRVPRDLRSARRLAADALVRVDEGGAYANLVLPAMLGASRLDGRDRAFATELVYGTTRMRRACDWLVDRYLATPPDPRTRAVLRLGAYQLAFLGMAPHAAVGETVAVAPGRTRGLVNAVLRRVAAEDGVDWPDDATRLSYPDWVVRRLVGDLGEAAALAALADMNRPAPVTVRPDGYVQDGASQRVVEAVAAEPGERVADVCAAPGGKATAMAEAGAFVVAGDRRPSRAGLVVANARRLGLAAGVAAVVADARRPPHPPGSFDRALVDAPCSGLGSLRRRPDARWRIEETAVERLAALQVDLVVAAAALVRPGGLLVYSACTLTRPEGDGVVEAVAARLGDRLVAVDDPPVTVMLPAAGSDGMVVARWRVASPR